MQNIVQFSLPHPPQLLCTYKLGVFLSPNLGYIWALKTLRLFSIFYMFSVFMNIEMQSSWLKQCWEQKGGSKMRGWKYQWTDIHHRINGITELYGHLQWTPWQSNTEWAQQTAITEFVVCSAFLQIPTLALQLWITVTFPFTSLGLAE